MLPSLFCSALSNLSRSLCYQGEGGAFFDVVSFFFRYRKSFGSSPVYQAVANFAGGLLLVKAIEEIGSLDPQLVAAHLARMRVRTV